MQKERKKRDEKVASETVGIKTNNPKVNINLVVIFDPKLPFFLSTHVCVTFLITLKQSINNRSTSIDNVVIAIVGVVLI